MRLALSHNTFVQLAFLLRGGSLMGFEIVNIDTPWGSHEECIEYAIKQKGRIPAIAKYIASIPPNPEALERTLNTIAQGFLEIGLLEEAKEDPNAPPFLLMAHQVLIALLQSPGHLLALSDLIIRSNGKHRLLCEALAWLNKLGDIAIRRVGDAQMVELHPRGFQHASHIEPSTSRFFRIWRGLPYYVLVDMARNIKHYVKQFNQEHPEVFEELCRACTHCRLEQTPDQAYCGWLEETIRLAPPALHNERTA
ncbi:MAG: hypothetical protein D6690_17935 [Nitrospirae bacterium]|nr:MAG: hypothetical protein D6690_17935 [Nitrospirota bacterium]